MPGNYVAARGQLANTRLARQLPVIKMSKTREQQRQQQQYQQ